MTTPTTTELICTQELMYGAEMTAEELALSYARSQVLRQDIGEVGEGSGKWRYAFESAEVKLVLRGKDPEQAVAEFATALLPYIRRTLETSPRFGRGTSGGFVVSPQYQIGG